LTAWTTKDRRHFVKQTIKIGLRQAGYDQVLSGLADQELVVTDGAVFLSNKLYGGATD
jgi:cobalt-zinc-cadmium efflux system membrane fusion protein